MESLAALRSRPVTCYHHSRLHIDSSLQHFTRDLPSSSYDLLTRRRALGNDSYEDALQARATSVHLNRVFVVNLPWQTTRDELTDLMEKAGKVRYAEVLMDTEGRSKGCGIVEYEDLASAERAINQLSMQEFVGRKIFVKPDTLMAPKYGREGIKLYIGNVPRNFRWQQLKDLFRDYGPASQATIRPGNDGELWGSLVVRDPRAAALAIAELNGFVAGVDGSKLIVTTWEERPSHVDDSEMQQFGPPRRTEDGSRQLVVLNLPEGTTNMDLLRLFQFGGTSLKRAEVLPEEGKTRGVGMLEFDSVDDARRALDFRNGYEYGRRILRVRPVGNPHIFTAFAATQLDEGEDIV